MHAFHESPDRIYTDLTCAFHKKSCFVFLLEHFDTSLTNSVNPVQTAPVGAV